MSALQKYFPDSPDDLFDGCEDEHEVEARVDEMELKFRQMEMFCSTPIEKLNDAIRQDADDYKEANNL